MIDNKTGNKSSRKHLNHLTDATLADGTEWLIDQALIASNRMFAWHYYWILLLHLAENAFLFRRFERFTVVYVKLALVYQIGTQFKLRFIF